MEAVKRHDNGSQEFKIINLFNAFVSAAFLAPPLLSLICIVDNLY